MSCRSEKRRRRRWAHGSARYGTLRWRWAWRAGAAVSACGILGFVGLLAPHLARMLAGGLHLRLLPVSALIGALLVLLADTLGRAALPPLELPAGVIFTTLLGAPYFLYLLRRAARTG